MNENTICWFVGSLWDGKEDQFDRFIGEGIWETGYKNKLKQHLLQMKPGDRIAVKSSYTKKRNLPFNNNGFTVSVMRIRAIGTITENPEDGKTVRVEWENTDMNREWYFYTFRGTIWKVQPENWLKENLIEFTFNNGKQDIDRFRNEPYWRDRYGDSARTDTIFQWIRFYEELADKLLLFKNKRTELLEILFKIDEKTELLNILNDEKVSGTKSLLEDICPFTVFGLFNRHITFDNRKTIAQEYARAFGIEAELPQKFDGVPILNNQNTWFFSYAYARKEDDIQKLWNIFEQAVTDSENRTDEQFIELYDQTAGIKSLGWKLTIGLFWIRPNSYLTLDSNTRTFLEKNHVLIPALN